MSERTRGEHVRWCKQRALEYVEMGDLPQAVASMASDLGKHDDTVEMQSLIVLATPSVAANDTKGVRDWIEGFTE